MAKNQSTYTLKIDAELGNLQKTLNDAKNSLASFMQSGNAPKGLEKAFEKINNLLGQISDKAGKPLDLKGLTGAGKDLSTIQENFRAIVRLLGEFDDLSEDVKLSFVSPEEQKKVKDITSALEAYGKAADEVAKKIKSLDAANKTQSKNEGVLSKAKKKVSDLENDQIRTKGKLAGAQGKLDAARLDGSSAKDIAKYEAEVVKLRAELEILDKNLGSANEELTKAQSVYNASAKSVKDLESEIKRMGSSSLKELKEEAKALGVSFEGLNGHDAAKQVEILSARMLELKKQIMGGAKPAFDKFQEECKQGEKAAEGLEKETQGAIKSVEQMNEAASERENFENKIKQFLGLSGAAHVMRAALRDAMSTITELDAVMGQMAVVTDLTVGDYWDQLPEYSERASNLGVSITEAYEAATLYYQQGLKANEVTALSEQTLKMAAIAGLDAADATDRMTAALRGFNMELNEANAQKIADVYSELAAITASDVDEISTAMTKTASIAASAGMEFETTAAFLSQIIETTRESAETAGTAMKTVIARFQELKKDPSEIGEIEGEIVDANAIETALRSVGVALRDSSGQFRELDEVFLELSSKWDTLDKNTQRYIATIAAGSRQQSRFIAMMSDYERTQELVTAANNSAGASQRQFEKTTETLAFKIERLKNAWHEFTMGIMNSDLVKTGVDILTTLLEIVNKITSAFKGMGGSLTKIIGIVAVFNIGKAIYEKIAGPVSGFFLTQLPKIARESGFQSGSEWKKGAEAAMSEQQSQTEEQTVDNFKYGYYRDDKGRVRGPDGKIAKESDAQRGVLRTFAGKYSGADKIYEGNQYGKNRKKISAELKKMTEGTEAYKKKQQEMLAEGQKQWQAYGAAVKQAGQSITSAGMALSVFGGLLSSMGFEKWGEAFVKLGNGAMIAGTIVTALGQALSYIPTILKVIQSNPWILVITAALALIIGMITAIVSEMKKNSPETKLKEAQEASEKAAEAAERAKEAYEGLSDAIGSIGEKYEEMNKLIQGTEAWREALIATNQEVLDLIDLYPELANHVDYQNGLMKIDFDKKEVKQIMRDIESQSINATIAEQTANIKTNNAELAVRREQLENLKTSDAASVVADEISQLESKLQHELESVYWIGPQNQLSRKEYVSDAEFQAADERMQALSDEIVKKQELHTELTANKTLTDTQMNLLSSGLISGEVFKNEEGVYDATDDLLEAMGISRHAFVQLSDSIEDSKDDLINFGKSALQTAELNEAIYDTIASTIASTVDTTGMSQEKISQMYNFASGSVYEETYNKVIDTWLDDADLDQRASDQDWGESVYDATDGMIDQAFVNKALENAGYKDASLGKKGNVVYRNSEGDQVTDQLSEDEIKRIVATYYASSTVKEQAEYAAVYVDYMSSELKGMGESSSTVEALGRALRDENGAYLTSNDLEALKALSDEDLAEAFEKLPEKLKEIYGTADALWKKVESATTGAAHAEGSIFKQVTGYQAEFLEDINKKLGGDNVNNSEFSDQFNKAMDALSKYGEDVAQEFASMVAGMSYDTTNRGNWEKIEAFLAEWGYDPSNFMSATAGAFGAKYSIGDLTAFGATSDVIEEYINTSDQGKIDRFHTTFKQWQKDYKIANSEAKKAEHDLITQAIEALENGYEEQIQAYEDSYNATAEANNKLISRISENIEHIRQQRDNEEKEKEIADNLSLQSYLGMDTSGSNALTLLKLQEEEKQMAQEYEDSLVDQALAKLEDANAKAEEQRERQIELARQQLEYYKESGQIAAEARNLVRDAQDQLLGGGDIANTALGKLLKPENFASEFERASFWNNIRDLLSQSVESGESTVVEDYEQSLVSAAGKAEARNAISKMVSDQNNKIGGVDDDWRTSEDYTNARDAYIAAQGKASAGAEFDLMVDEALRGDNGIKGGSLNDDIEVTNKNNLEKVNTKRKPTTGDMTVKMGGKSYTISARYATEAWGEESTAVKETSKFTYLTGTTVSSGDIAALGGEVYIYSAKVDRWLPISGDKFKQAYFEKLRSYETGGLANFTGPAWLDGTPSKPEYILNAAQTERFFSLVNVLESLDSKESGAKSSGDNYFDIEINVEKLENDYDLEQVANKIRSMIYEDATYRNVNAINNIR